MSKNNRFQKTLHLISLVILSVILASCNLPRATSTLPTFPPLPTGTNTPRVDTPTPTSLVPLPSNPSPTATTSGSPSGGTVNILFAPGTTAAVEAGTIQAGQVQDYTLNVGNSQPLILILTSNLGDAYLGVNDPSGNVVLDPAKKWSRWQWLMPAKVQLYTIHVYGVTAGDYVLTVKVPVRITFPSGSNSASLAASTTKGFVFSYTLQAGSGQTLTADLTVPSGSAAMDIFGLASGDSLLGISQKATHFSGPLPSTQDYIIEIAPLHGDVVDFTLNVSVH